MPIFIDAIEVKKVLINMSENILICTLAFTQFSRLQYSYLVFQAYRSITKTRGASVASSSGGTAHLLSETQPD